MYPIIVSVKWAILVDPRWCLLQLKVCTVCMTVFPATALRKDTEPPCTHIHTYTHPVWQVWDPQSCTWCHCTHEAIDSCTLHHKWWSHNVTVCTETQLHDALHMIRTGSDIAVHTNTSKYSLSKVLLGTCTAVNEHKQFPLFYIALSRVCCANTTNTFDMCMCITVDWFEQCNVPEVDILSLSVTQRLRS